MFMTPVLPQAYSTSATAKPALRKPQQPQFGMTVAAWRDGADSQAIQQAKGHVGEQGREFAKPDGTLYCDDSARADERATAQKELRNGTGAVVVCHYNEETREVDTRVIQPTGEQAEEPTVK